MPMSERELLVRARDALLTCSPGDYSTGQVIHPQYDEATVETVLADIDAHLKEPEKDMMNGRTVLSDDQIIDIWADVSADYDDSINIIAMARAVESAVLAALQQPGDKP